MENNKTTSSQKSEIQFKPVTEGLGFHPFSDGLPYAPMGKNPSKSSLSSGTGATLSGKPKIATPQRTPQVVAVPPKFTKQVPQISVPVALQSETSESLSRPLHAQLELDKIEQEISHLGFGYMLKRVLAFLLDSVINLSFCGAGLVLFVEKQNPSSDFYFNPSVLAVSSLFLILFNWSLISTQEVIFNTSLGKRLFGLRLDGPAAKIFIRSVLFIPSFGFLGAGLFLGLFDKQKRCWHDAAVQLQPIPYR